MILLTPAACPAQLKLIRHNGHVFNESNVILFGFLMVTRYVRCALLHVLPSILTRKWMRSIRCNILADSAAGPWTIYLVCFCCWFCLCITFGPTVIYQKRPLLAQHTQQSMKTVCFWVWSPKTHFRSLWIVTKWNCYYYHSPSMRILRDWMCTEQKWSIVCLTSLICAIILMQKISPLSGATQTKHTKHRRRIEIEDERSHNLQSSWLWRIRVTGFRHHTNDTMQFLSKCIKDADNKDEYRGLL